MSRPPESPCAAALLRFAESDLSEWQGLPADCRLADVEELWQPVDTPALHLALGNKRRPATARRFELAPGRWLRVWSQDGGLIELDVEGPLQLDSAALGEPEARLTAHVGFAAYTGGEWVFARRGLAVGVSPDSGAVHYAAAFAPTSVDTYLQLLRIDRAQRPLRQGGSGGA